MAIVSPPADIMTYDQIALDDDSYLRVQKVEEELFKLFSKRFKVTNTEVFFSDTTDNMTYHVEFENGITLRIWAFMVIQANDIIIPNNMRLRFKYIDADVDMTDVCMGGEVTALSPGPSLMMAAYENIDKLIMQTKQSIYKYNQKLYRIYMNVGRNKSPETAKENYGSTITRFLHERKKLMDIVK